MSQLELETIDAPTTFGEALRPGADELTTMAGEVTGFTADGTVFGFEETGTALAAAYLAAKEAVTTRLEHDAEVITAAADALRAISAGYTALVEANTPTGN
jgi:hypothetical protein